MARASGGAARLALALGASALVHAGAVAGFVLTREARAPNPRAIAVELVVLAPATPEPRPAAPRPDPAPAAAATVAKAEASLRVTSPGAGPATVAPASAPSEPPPEPRGGSARLPAPGPASEAAPPDPPPHPRRKPAPPAPTRLPARAAEPEASPLVTAVESVAEWHGDVAALPKEKPVSGPGEPAGTGTGESFAGLTPAPPPAGERATPAAIAYAAPGLRRGGGNAPPLYPVAARRRGIEGRVLLRVEVSPQGRAAEVAVIESSGHALLDEAAQRAVSRWSFEPARAGGVPVPGSIEIPVVFRLGG